MPTSPPSTALVREITEGVHVDVRSRYDQHWCHGFTVDSIEDQGVSLRRDSDDTVLPVVFPLDEVRLDVAPD